MKTKSVCKQYKTNQIINLCLALELHRGSSDEMTLPIKRAAADEKTSYTKRYSSVPNQPGNLVWSSFYTPEDLDLDSDLDHDQEDDPELDKSNESRQHGKRKKRSALQNTIKVIEQ